MRSESFDTVIALARALVIPNYMLILQVDGSTVHATGIIARGVKPNPYVWSGMVAWGVKVGGSQAGTSIFNITVSFGDGISVPKGVTALIVIV